MDTIRSTKPLLLLLVGCLAAPAHAQPKTPVKDPSPERFAKAIAAFAQQDRKTPPAAGVTVFVGSSSIRRWDLAKSFGELAALNRGFGGSHISDVSHYAQQTVLKYRPRKVVFFCGGNDLASGKTPRRVAADFRRFTTRLFEAAPKVRLIVLAIKPSPRRWNIVDQIRRTNALLRAHAEKDKRIVFLDKAFDALLGDDGKPREELFVKDGLHLSQGGYRRWARLVAPHLKEGE